MGSTIIGKGYVAGAETCCQRGCRTVVVTLGKGVPPGGAITLESYSESGHRRTALCYVRDAGDARGKYVFPSSPDIGPVVDTTGAGDAFAAGFLYGLLNGKGLEECGRLGNIVAQFSISEIGARQGLPTISELSQRYHELYPEQRLI